MKKNWLIIFFVFLFSCKQKEEYFIKTDSKVDWKPVQEYYYKNLEIALQYIDSLQKEGFQRKKTKLYFSKTREAFKRAEPYAGYLNPEVTHKVNGPSLSVFKEDSGKVIAPVGLQKLEETIYGEDGTQNIFDSEINLIKGMLNNLQKGVQKRTPNPQRFFVATHQQLIRLVALATAGFDTPVSGLSINESGVSLSSLEKAYELSIEVLIKAKNPELNDKFHNQIKKAVTFVNKNTDFESFDRYTFIRDYLNPITRTWVNIRKESELWEGSKVFPFNFEAPTFFEEDSFNPDFFAKSNNRFPTERIIKLGKKLFFDKNISENKTMSCATCHVPSKAYSDGFVLGKDNKGKPLLRNTPTLLNSSFQKAFFWDGRSGTLESQIASVFTNKEEFNTNTHRFSKAILKDSTYINLFKSAYGYIPTSNKEVVKAISSYVATLKSFNSKFDKNIRGEEDTFIASEKRGFNLYMGKALCATCHFIPLTNGTVPPFFSETEKEVIGVPETVANKKLDDDTGFYWVYEKDIHKGMFKTPSIRNASLTAPYMHNGVYNTLEEVIDFYVQGGGIGLGFDLPHQTLPFDKLDLTDQDKKDLIAFINTLTDISTKN